MASQPPILTDDDIRRVRVQSAPPQGPRPIPRVIQGPPREPPPQTPVNAARDEVGLQADRQQIEARRIQMERDRLAADQARRTASDPAGDAPGSQRRDAGFYLRAARSNGLYEQHQVAPRGVVGQTAADAFPRIANVNADPERQMAEAAQGDFIGATLRYESGAAVPPAEFEMQRQRYFPQPGDSPQVIEFKAELRRNAIEALQRSAGQAANGIDPTPINMRSGPSGMATRLVEQVVDASQVAARPGAGGTGGASAPTAPGSPPPDPNQVQPGESMGQVGNLPNVPVDTGRNVAGAAGAQLTDADRRLASAANALVASRLPVPEVINRINQILEAGGRPFLTAGQAEAIRAARRNGARFEFTPTPSGQSQRQQISDTMQNIVGSGGGVATAANALDSASLGAPGLFSEDYRNAMGDLRNEHPVASTVGMVVGSLAAPGGPRPGMNMLEQSVRSGGQGAVYAFNESGGDPEAAAVGAGIGGAAPGAFRVATGAARATRNALMPRGNFTDPEAQALANALQQENIPGSRPLLDPSRRDRMAYLESSAGSGGPIREGLDATRRGVEERAGQLHGQGVVQERPVMGQRVQDAGTRFRDESRVPLQRSYERAGELAGDTPIYAREFVTEIDQQISQLNRSPSRNRAVINYLQSIRRDFVDADGNLLPRRIDDIRELRTDLSGEISRRSLTRTRAEGLMTRALDRARADIQRDLHDIHTLNPGSEAGQRAQQAWDLYRRADIGWGLRSRELRQVVERLVGPADSPFGGGQVMNNLRSWLAHDPVRAERMMSKLNASERADLTATYAESLGREAADEPFSPALFLRRTRALPDASRRLLFGDEGAQSIENLRRISQALKDTQGRLNNSRSGMVSNWRGWLRDLTSGGPAGAAVGALSGGSATVSGLTGAAVGATTALTGLAIRRMSAKAMMNPDLSRWLAAAPRATTAQAIRSHIGRLSGVAARSPAIAQEVAGLRQSLMNAVNDNAIPSGQLAASPNERPDQQ